MHHRYFRPKPLFTLCSIVALSTQCKLKQLSIRLFVALSSQCYGAHFIAKYWHRTGLCANHSKSNSSQPASHKHNIITTFVVALLFSAWASQIQTERSSPQDQASRFTNEDFWEPLLSSSTITCLQKILIAWKLIEFHSSSIFQTSVEFITNCRISI